MNNFTAASSIFLALAATIGVAVTQFDVNIQRTLDKKFETETFEINEGDRKARFVTTAFSRTLTLSEDGQVLSEVTMMARWTPDAKKVAKEFLEKGADALPTIPFEESRNMYYSCRQPSQDLSADAKITLTGSTIQTFSNNTLLSSESGAGSLIKRRNAARAHCLNQ